MEVLGYFTQIGNVFIRLFALFDTIKYQGISIFAFAVFCLFLALLWRFLLAPIFTGSGGLSAGVSDTVKSSMDRNKKTDRSPRSEHYFFGVFFK